MRIALPGLSLTAAVRMVDRIHDDSTNVWPTAEPSRAPRFADGNILMIEIADLPDGRHTGSQNSPHLPGLQSHLHIAFFAAHNLGKTAGAADQLPALARLQLDVVDRGPQRHRGQGKRIPWTDFRSRTGLHHVIDAQPLGHQNVAFLSVDIGQ